MCSSDLAELCFEVQLTPHRLIVDVSHGFDVVVVGADKWAQIVDPVWYANDVAARDAALAALPHVALAPRPPASAPASSERITVLDLGDPLFAEVSSSAVRLGRTDWLAR